MQGHTVSGQPLLVPDFSLNISFIYLQSWWRRQWGERARLPSNATANGKPKPSSPLGLWQLIQTPSSVLHHLSLQQNKPHGFLSISRHSPALEPSTPPVFRIPLSPIAAPWYARPRILHRRNSGPDRNRTASLTACAPRPTNSLSRAHARLNRLDPPVGVPWPRFAADGGAEAALDAGGRGRAQGRRRQARARQVAHHPPGLGLQRAPAPPLQCWPQGDARIAGDGGRWVFLGDQLWGVWNKNLQSF